MTIIVYILNGKTMVIKKFHIKKKIMIHYLIIHHLYPLPQEFSFR